ncbi:MAG: hypothetical protein JO243_24970 [Solirubrobacterales bacterium]|nr:hypothetical protein [Solirubrobacterales bacterium]MBV9339154.1 hypothetical protein [Solirubrobacterales bacterium]
MHATQRIFGLARPRPSVTWADMLAVMQLEAAHVWSLYERGIARDAWIRTDAPGAVYVLESTPAEAERVLGAQPMVRCGLVGFELVPVGPFMPLSLLFGTEEHPVPTAATTAARRGRSCRVLAIERPRAGIEYEELDPLLAEEARYVWSLWKAGVIRENYARTDRPGAALILEVAGIDEADAILAELPLVRQRLIEFECLAVGAFSGFDALLEGALDD